MVDHLQPRESAQYIFENAKHVSINNRYVNELTHRLFVDIREGTIDFSNLKLYPAYECYPQSRDWETVEWILVVKLMTFGLWIPANWNYGPSPSKFKPLKFSINGRGGSFAICKAINRALDEGIPITDAKYYANIDEETLRKILRADKENVSLQLMTDRVKILNEVGECLIKKWEGKFSNMVRAANNSSMKLLELMLQDMPCLHDEVTYMEKKVSFYKQAQKIIGDIWVCFEGQDFGNFHDISNLTPMSSYRSSQSLLQLRCLFYRPNLWEIIKNDTILRYDDVYSIEIQGVSNYIVDLITNKLNKRFNGTRTINALHLDNYFYQYRRAHCKEIWRYHGQKVISTHM